MTTPLTPDEHRDLERHEAAIAEAMRSWVRLGGALAAILAGRLFRATHASFDEYVEDRWQIKRRQGYHLAAGAEMAAKLETAGLPPPPTERHVRPLAGLDHAVAAKLWKAAIRAGFGIDRVTAQHVQDVVREYRGGIEEQKAQSGGRVALSDEGKALVEAYETQAKEGKSDPVEPLVAVPPHLYGDGAGSRSMLVPSSQVPTPSGFRSLNRKTFKALGRAFKKHFDAKGGKGPVMNLTNEHVGWALWTLNVATGCTWTCPFCYAREIAKLRYEQGFAPTIHPERFLAPAGTRIPKKYADLPEARRVFLGSQTDWMDPSFPDWVIQATLDMCAENPEWTFMTLTKQPERLADFEYPDNVWIGITVTRQGQVAAAEEAFAEIDAAVRWVSFEPLHGPVVLAHPELVDLYVIGAERKTRQREAVKATEAAWVDALRMQARSVGASVWEKENLHVWLREMPEPRRSQTTGLPVTLLSQRTPAKSGRAVSTRASRGAQAPTRRRPANADSH